MTVGGETIVADYIVVSLGAELAPEVIPGLEETGHNFYTLTVTRSSPFEYRY